MPRMGYEPVTPVFQRAKMAHALDRAATVIGGVDVQIHVFLNLALDADELWLHDPAALSPGKEPIG
jgi:hypothetical protein